MDAGKKTRPLGGDEVVSLQDQRDKFSFSHTTFKVAEMIAGIKTNWLVKEKWLAEGVECEILSPGGDWQKGRIKISLEFCPDEVLVEAFESYAAENRQEESPLDEIRQMISGEDVVGCEHS
jgi:KGK domain